MESTLFLSSAHLQDFWVLSALQGQTGYFVEIGGFDGKTVSNTYSLEKYYGWKGIVVEPGRGFRVSLETHRQCELDFRAVWDVTGTEIVFKEDMVEGYLSVAVEDELINTKNGFLEYKVETVSLYDLLKQHGAPQRIDYVSIDIEGTELRVLKAFFEENIYYEVKCWTVEHNFRNSKSDLENLFALHGYKAVHKELSYRDYWFIKD